MCLQYKKNYTYKVTLLKSNLRLHPGGGGGTPYIGLYGEALPKRGTFFRLQVYKGVGISQVEVYKRVGQSAQRELNK